MIRKIHILLALALMLGACGQRNNKQDHIVMSEPVRHGSGTYTFYTNQSDKSGKSDYLRITGFAQGTTYNFVINTQDTVGLQHSIDSLILAVDISMSVYKEGSLLNRLNGSETDSLDKYIAYCIDVAREFSEISDGAYDITIKPVTQALGYAGGEAEKNPNIDSLMQYVGYEKIRIEGGRLIKENPNVQIDLNSVAQGYTADLLGMLMESRCIKNYMVEIGGEIFCRGLNRFGKPWQVGIDSPKEGNMISGADTQIILEMSNMGLATSGNYRKFYTADDGSKVTHIVNAKTGRSEPSRILSATVIADNATIADVAGTVFMIVGLERSIEILKEHPGWMGYLVYDDGKGGFATYATDNLKRHIVSGK